ncbi:hypothetical protein RUA07_000006 [Listeria innocua]|uniref:hypothetical protein n=1 Tax=Listeria seeligeri TaxID=1640 RepID=UPI0010B12DC4|nr:hypothetical protein [Listeria seeligeri]EHF3593801.1 hypothetical protein [Listeria innocua]EIA6531431.1 hypothetical protein [Listeria monocytogenes]EHF3608874.1 hypothetical protein [Listeria innocua]ELD8302418.1 hypothetical protein [Listeria innocua]ELD8354080.1 hypothetical protein [Listeria innocua]
MQITFPYILTSLIALSSIISPVIVTVMNNKHSLKLKEKEEMIQHTREQKTQVDRLFQSYLSAVGKATANPTSENIKTYCEIYFTTLIHVPADKIYIYSEIYDYITSVNNTEDNIENNRALSIKNCLEQSVLPIIREIIEKS